VPVTSKGEFGETLSMPPQMNINCRCFCSLNYHTSGTSQSASIIEVLPALRISSLVRTDADKGASNNISAFFKAFGETIFYIQ